MPEAKDIIELKDSQAVVFANDEHRIVEGQVVTWNGETVVAPS